MSMDPAGAPLSSADHSTSSSIFARLCIEHAIKKLKVSLSFSKSPLQTFVKMIFVILSMSALSRYCEGSLFATTLLLMAFSALFVLVACMALLKRRWIYCKEYWYIGSMSARSLITKKRMDPRTEMLRYALRISSISASRTVDSSIFIVMSWAILLETSRVWISSTSSRIFSAFALAKSSKMFFSDYSICLRKLARFCTFWSRRSSTSGRSCFTTSARSWSSRPSNVAVKFITVVFMKISG